MSQLTLKNRLPNICLCLRNTVYTTHPSWCVNHIQAATKPNPSLHHQNNKTNISERGQRPSTQRLPTTSTYNIIPTHSVILGICIGIYEKRSEKGPFFDL